MLARALDLAKKTLRMGSYFVDPGPSEIKWATETLLIEYGHAKSRRAGRPIDKDGRPLPWYTYPAIAYLGSIDLKDRHVFEYGSGSSSQFWAGLAASVTSVEHDPGWHERVTAEKRPNQELLLVESGGGYVDAIRRAGRKYGVVAIDGELRLPCARAAVDCLADDGLVVLDNADWFPRTTEFLRSADLIEVDFTGFGPILNMIWTTSVFLRRSIRVRPREDRLPAYGVAAVRQVMKED